MIHKEFWGILFLAFVAWIFVASTPTDRINNSCRPIGWGGNVVVSVSAMVMPTEQKTVEEWFNKFEYGCRYTIWRLFFQAEYNKFVQGQSGKSPDSAVPESGKASPDAASPASPPVTPAPAK